MIWRLLIDPFQAPFMARALVELVILGVLAGTVGVLVLLRRLAFVTDALTHTVFPGVVIGFLAAGEDGIFWGALAAGALTAVLLTALTARRRVSEDAALAILLTTLFSLGVVLVSRQAGYTADLTAFLFGRVLTVTEAQLVQTGIVTAFVMLVLYALRRPLLLRTFDPDGARAAGYRIGALDVVLNVVIALVVVAAVRAIGTILVIALLIVPAATARVLSDRLVVIIPLGDAPRVLIVELSCAFVDVRGLTALLLADQQAYRRGVHLMLAGVSPTLRRVVRLFGPEGRLPCFASLPEDLAARREDPEQSEPCEDGPGHEHASTAQDAA